MDRGPFRFLRNLNRSREIATVLLNHGFRDIVERIGLWRYLQWGHRLLFRRSRSAEPRLTRSQRIRLALQDLGPTFIKFGQVLSTRPDLLPDELIKELTLLQEQVPPFSGEEAVRLLEEELGASVEELFAEFDRVPLAAGSLGQVHRARRRDGLPLAVKIRRPHAMRDVERDLSLMEELAVLFERHLPETEIFDPSGLVAQFARSIRRELNFQREGRTVDEFARLFRNDATLIVPQVDWDLTTEAVLTLEFIDGYRLCERAEMEAAGIPLPALASNGARIFFKQVFEFGLFHGDPHPGNLRICRGGTLALLDYGMVGRIEEDKRDQLVDLLVAVTRSDAKSAVDMILIVGRAPREVDRTLLQSDVRDFVETYYGVSLERIEMARMLGDFVAILGHHGIRYPAEFMLLIRAMITLDGVGRSLDPEFNLATHLAPFIRRILRERYNPKRMAARWMTSSSEMLGALHNMPLHLERTLAKLGRDDLRLQLDHRNLDYFVNELDRTGNRMVIGMIVAALIMASAMIVRTDASGNISLISIGLFVLSSLLGIWLIYGVFRSGRL